jgi:hypothetical protein
MKRSRRSPVRRPARIVAEGDLVASQGEVLAGIDRLVEAGGLADPFRRRRRSTDSWPPRRRPRI